MKKRRRPISSINVVPYLDVMLVLLVIFMITAPLFNQGAVDLPSVGETALPKQKSGAMEIVYHPSSGELRYQLINHHIREETPRLSLAELLQKLDEEKLLRPDAPIVITADSSLQYGEVMELVGVLRDGNYEPIALNSKSGAQ